VAINYTRGAICSARQTHAKKRIKRKIIVWVDMNWFFLPSFFSPLEILYFFICLQRLRQKRSKWNMIEAKKSF
jgi:hypothetical protein